MFSDFLNSSSKTLIMGILNVTPDSFFDGHNNINSDYLTNKFKELILSDIIDIGAESSRPGSNQIDFNNEINRLKKVLPFIKENKHFYSIDTYKVEVAEFALNNGFNIVNDISGGNSANLLDLVAEKNAPIILMHMQGNPKTMQENPKYNNIIEDLLKFFDDRINNCIKRGIKLDNIILDPGIGFGKTVSDNDLIIRKLNIFKKFNLPLLVGISRKSFLSINNDKPKHRLNSSLSIGSIAINNGADILRVHDVKKSIHAFSLVDRVLNKV